MSAPADALDLASRLRRLACEQAGVAPEATQTDSIRDIGLSSGQMLAFLVAVEDLFDFSWDEDVDPAVLTSFAAMARHVSERARSAGAG